MNKKLGRALRPGQGVYILAMALFASAALVLQQYVLAVVGFVFALVMLLIYGLGRRHRSSQLQAFIQEALQSKDISRNAESPLAMVLIRLGDGGVLWHNMILEL